MSLAAANIKKVSENNYQVSYGDDQGVYAEFFNDVMDDPVRTKAEGRPCYKNAEFIRMVFPGDTSKERIRPVRLESDGREPSDPERFPKQWAAFKSQTQQVQDGTPIEQWPPINKAQAMELKALNIHTVEQLASVHDGNLTWMGARELRDNAAAWLREAETGKETISLRNQIVELQNQITALQNTNAAMPKVPTPQPVATPQAAPAAPAAPVPSPVPAAPLMQPIVPRMAAKPSEVNNGADVPTAYPANG